MNRSRLLAIALVLSVLAACGQKASTREGAVTPAPVESGPLHPMRGAGNATLASDPADVHCGSQPAVWANSRTKIYHMVGDPSYGHTKFGGYICERDAVRAGYRPSKH